jgi:anti-sigma regulatory factor (Ser/Thr protein kinase)
LGNKPKQNVMTTVATECTGTPGTFKWELRGDPELLSELRLQLRRYLARSEVPADVAADVILSLHEAAKNALRADGGRPVEVLVWREGDLLRARVRDHGAGFQMARGQRCPRAWQTRGRGLYLIRSLMDSVEVDCSDGVTVSMSKRRPSS